MRLKPSATLAAAARARALAATGVDLARFDAGEPDFDTPEFLKAAAGKALADGWTKYVESAGPKAAREAVAAKLRRENSLADVTAEHVVITAGTKHAYYMLLTAVIEPGAGHEVILPTPAWVSYRPIAELAGAKVVEVGTTAGAGFRMTPGQLRAVLSPRSRVLVVNSPSNPCGIVYTPGELAGIAEVVNAHNAAGGDLIVASDEIYEKLVYGGAKFASIGTMLRGEAAVTINGLGKAYAMTGWRIGYAAAAPALASAIAKLQSQMNTSLTALCYPVMVAALERGAEDVERMRKEYEKRGAMMFEMTASLPGGVGCVRPEGAFYVFPEVSAYFGRTTAGGVRIESADAFAGALLHEAHVAVVPGEEFGGCGARHIRMSFATSTARIEEGMSRVRRFCEGMR